MRLLIAGVGVGETTSEREAQQNSAFYDGRPE